jgi:pilus assembly protein CpaC
LSPLRLRVHPRRGLRAALAAGLAAWALAHAPAASAQTEAPEGRTIVVPAGKATLVTHSERLTRVSIANPAVAEAVVVSPHELLLNGRANGTTTLVIWDAGGRREFFAVEVTADAEALDRQLESLFPDDPIDVSATGNVFILSGSASNDRVARRAVEIAESTGLTVVDNISVPAPNQILLQVRFAEVSRSAVKELGVNLARVDPLNLRGDDEGILTTGRFTPPGGNFINQPGGPEQTFSDVVNLYLFDRGTQVGAFIRALQAKGMFKSLAEPNLLALDGQEATFLAGGEFPYPVPQASASGTSITIFFKEFGVRLTFTPEVTNSGNIKLKVAPEVSTLDFANGIQLSGFRIPSLLTRRATTEVELRDGQTFAIAGLIDNSVSENVDKFPILGDIPVLGMLFSSKDVQQNRTELLVLVTPRIVHPSATPPPLPTGEPETWDWERSLRGSADPQGDR